MEDSAGSSAGRFIGRARELVDLRSGLNSSIAGRGGLFLVSGEPGIGKTKLADQLSTEAESEGAIVLWGRCWEGSGAPAYWPWIQIVRAALAASPAKDLSAALGPGREYLARIVPDIGANLGPRPATSLPQAMEPEEERFLLFDTVSTFLKLIAGQKPVLLVLDDVHSADHPSLLLLQFVARELRSAALLVIATYRETEARRTPHVTRVLGELARDARSLPLRGLSEGEVSQLVERSTGVEPSRALVEPLFRATGGNPFFIDEVLRLLAAEGGLDQPDLLETGALAIPDRVREAIRRRIDPLPDGCDDLLMAAAVVGEEFDLSLLERVTGLGSEQVLAAAGHAVAAGIVLRTAGGLARYRFAHSLVRDALYGELSPGHAVRMHRKVAEALEECRTTTAGNDIAELAHHHFEAALGGGDVERALHWCVRAAEQAYAQLAYEEAVRHYERGLQALEVCGDVSGRRACAIYLALGEAQSCVGDPDRARASYQRATALARDLDDADLFARAALGFERMWFFMVEVGKYDPELVALLQEALGRLGESDSELRARVAARLAVELHFSEERTRCDELSRAAVEIARRLNSPATLAIVIMARHVAMWGPDNAEERAELGLEVLRLAEESGDRDMAFTAHWSRYLDLLDLGNVAAAEAELEALEKMAGTGRRPTWTWLKTFARAALDLARGRLVDAERLAEEAFASGQRPHPRNATLAYCAQLALVRREQARAAEILPLAQALAAQSPRTAAFSLGVSWIASESGDTALARAEFARLAAAGFDAVRRDALWFSAMIVAAEGCWRFDDAANAAALYSLLEPLANRNAVGSLGTVCFGSTSRSLGQLAAVLERWDDAERHFANAVRENGRMGFRLWQATAQRDWAATLLRRGASGDVERARALIDSAHAFAASAGLVALSSSIEVLRANLAGGGVPAAAPAESASELMPSIPSRSSSAETPSPTAGGGFMTTPETSTSATKENFFRREGEYWTIRYADEVCRLRHAKGLDYLVTLLRHPGREFHVIELVADGVEPDAKTASEEALRAMGNAALATQGLNPGLGDAGEVLDGQAKASYKRRLRELDEDLADAESLGDTERTARIREEIDFLAREIAGAVGLSGRNRRSGSPSERARINVTRAVKSVLERVEQSHPRLAEHLVRTVRTGTFCGYFPDPSAHQRWVV